MDNVLEAYDKLIDVHELIDSTDYKHIYLTSDWHLLKYKYKSEYTGKKTRNKINTSALISWCKNHIKDNDIFLYLGDLAYRWLNEEDCKEAQEVYKSLPGKKILILGNHDRMQGPDFYNNCGFDYVFEEFIHGSIIFTHRPVDINKYPGIKLNIHGHIHEMKDYYTIIDPSTNVNVYPLAYNNKPVTLDYIIRHIYDLSKNNNYKPNAGYSESTIMETKRSNLPDSAFGIPEDRKFPLDTEQHVRSAIKLFGHAEQSKKSSLAKKIRAAASRYKIDIPDTTQVAKYLKENTFIDSNISNLIFDMGGVLVGDCTKECMYKNIKIPNELVDDIYEYIGCLIDSGKTHTSTIDEVKSIFPDKYKIYFNDICQCLVDGLYVYDYTYKMLTTLKERGYKLYYLSNWERWLYELEKDIFEPIIKNFDGGIFSFEVDDMKPNVSIYKLLLDRYNLNSKECMFFDDKNENIQAAINANIIASQFSSEVTPVSILAESKVHQKQTIMVNSNGNIEPFDISNIHWWYASSNRTIDISEEDYFKTIDDAISFIMNKSSEPNLPEDSEDNDLYIFICNGTRQDIDNCFEPICIGSVRVKPDREYEWLIQYPIEMNDGIFESISDNIDETALNTINPVVGLRKACIIKITNPDNTVNNTEFIMSPSIISDKYFAIDENAHICIRDRSYYKDYMIDGIYTISNPYSIDKIKRAYRENKTVDNTFFYTAIANKPMLTPDQINFDESFKEINISFMIESRLSDIASAHKIYMESMYGDIYMDSIRESDNELYKKYKKSYGLEIKSTIDGYAVYSNTTSRISSLSESIESITDEMVISVIDSNSNSYKENSIYTGYHPYFTPDEILSLEGYYSDIVDLECVKIYNEHLIALAHHGDHHKSAEQKIIELKERLRNTEDPEEIDQIKQDMIALGWNPEIEYNNENAIKAKNRYNKIIDEKYRWVNLYDITSIDTIEESNRANDKHSVHIVLHNNDGALLSKVITTVTNGDYSHATIGFDNNFNELFSFNGINNSNIVGGFSIEDINNINKDSKIAILTFFIDNKTYKKCMKVIDYFKTNIKNTSYGFISFLTVLFDGIKININNSMICSQFVDSILKIANFDITNKDSSKTTPNDIFRSVENTNKRIWLVYKGYVKDLNLNTIKNKINSLSHKPIDEICLIKEFKSPIGVNNNGDILLTNPFIDFESEYYNSHKILVAADKSNNIEAMKYELARLYYMNYVLERSIYHNKNLKNKDKNIKTRAKILNDFNKYIKIVLSKDKSFIFGKYYEQSPFYAHTLEVNPKAISTIGDMVRLLL